MDELIAHASSFFARVGRDDWWALADATVESMIDFMLEHADQVQVFAQEGFTPATFAPFAECEAEAPGDVRRRHQDGRRGRGVRVRGP